MAGNGYFSAAQCSAVLSALHKALVDGGAKASVTTDGITLQWRNAMELETLVKNWTRRWEAASGKRAKGTFYR